MAKLKRGAHMLFLNVKGMQTPAWYLVGKDIEDMSVDMGGGFETKKNILDETSVTDEGYTPSIEATPYYADPEDDIYDFLEDLALGRKSGDDCKAQYMEVIAKDKAASSHTAYTEDCKIEINSYGGDTSGFQIEFTIHPDGNRKKGTAALDKDKKPTFTEDTATVSGTE